MISIASQFGQVQYNVVKLILDTADDIINLPRDVKPGSTAFVIETSTWYMMNNQGEWKEVDLGSSGGSGGGGGGGSSNETIYEGGTVV